MRGIITTIPVNKLLIPFVVFVLFFTSCGPEVMYKQSVEVPQTGWHKDTVAIFKSEVTDLESTCHVLLQVSNNAKYSYSNLWFFVDAVSPSGHRQRDTLECLMADKRGDWYGESSIFDRDTYKSLHPYKMNIRFPEKGEYKYFVVQGMRDTILTGIHSVGIEVVKAK